ncbi:hypothetical protein MBANPS3_012518 [Mucor bainieri]
MRLQLSNILAAVPRLQALRLENLIKGYALTTDKPKLSGFISSQKKVIIQYLFNLNIVEWEDIRAEISKCCGDVKHAHKGLTNDKKMVDWVDVSNSLKHYKAFMMIEKNQSDALLNQARKHRQGYIVDITSELTIFLEKQLEDPFQEEEAKTGDQVRRGLKSCTFKSTLLFYNILDLVSTSANGSQEVLGDHFTAEKDRDKETRNPDTAIKSTVRTLLGLKDKSKHLSLDDTLIQAKNLAQDDTSKSFRKICKL